MLGDWGTRTERPWIAVIISFFQPFLAMLFLNRGRWALVYFGAELLILVGFLIVLPTSGSTSKVSDISKIILGLLTVVGVCHSFLVAKNWDSSQTLNRYARRWYVAAAAFYGFYAVLFAIRTYLYQPFNVPSAAMVPTVNVGDFFLAKKSAYAAIGPERGDIIVFRTPMYGDTVFFKRVVGMPGDRVQLKNSMLVINGSVMPKIRLADISVPCSTAQCGAEQYRETLPSGRSYRVIQLDPTGPYNNTDVFVVPPDSYFVLGDNRDNSADTRNTLGYVARQRILGRVAFKYIADGHWTWQAIN